MKRDCPKNSKPPVSDRPSAHVTKTHVEIPNTVGEEQEFEEAMKAILGTPVDTFIGSSVSTPFFG